MAITPTLTAQHWGPHGDQRFDYYAHPTRDAGGNPVVIFRHAGSGSSGNYQSVWTESSRLKMWVFQFLNAQTGAGKHFDVISVATAQRSLDSGNGSDGKPFATSRKAYMLEQVYEMQKAIIALKRLGSIGFGASLYKLDPDGFILFGDSHGANICSLSQMWPPMVESSSRFPGTAGAGVPGTAITDGTYSTRETSVVAGVVYYVGQPDIRNNGTADAIHYTLCTGWFGTSASASTQFDALPTDLRNTCSSIYFTDTGLYSFYRPHYLIYATIGDHIKPYGDPGRGAASVHDSQQAEDFAGSLSRAGLPYRKVVYTSDSEWTLADSPQHRNLSAWLSSTVDAYKAIPAFPATSIGGPR